MKHVENPERSGDKLCLINGVKEPTVLFISSDITKRISRAIKKMNQPMPQADIIF